MKIKETITIPKEHYEDLLNKQATLRGLQLKSQPSKPDLNFLERCFHDAIGRKENGDSYYECFEDWLRDNPQPSQVDLSKMEKEYWSWMDNKIQRDSIDIWNWFKTYLQHNKQPSLVDCTTCVHGEKYMDKIPCNECRDFDKHESDKK